METSYLGRDGDTTPQIPETCLICTPDCDSYAHSCLPGASLRVPAGKGTVSAVCSFTRTHPKKFGLEI